MKTRRSAFVLATATVAVVAAVALTSGLRVFAQTQATPGGSLAEIAAEIRLLRTALEDNGNKQTLASMLTAQQGRLQPYISQLAQIRSLLDDAVIQTRNANASYLATQAETEAPGPLARAREEILKGMQRNLDTQTAKENDLRNREAEIRQALQREEAVWNDLMNRLQQSIRR